MSDPNVVVARNTDKAPVSDLYSQTVAFSHYNNLSAQLPIDPATGAIVAGGAAEQAEQCFKNLQAIVESIGHDMNDIIRVSIFLADIMGLEARDAQTGAVLGKIADIMDLPAGNVYVIRGGEREIMVPAVPQFIAETNVEGGYIRVNMMEGL